MSALSPHAQLLEQLCAEQRRLWDSGERILASTYLEHHPTLADEPDYAVELIYNEILLREEHGETPQLVEYLARFPQFDDALRRLFEVHRAVAGGSLFGLYGSGLPTRRVPAEWRPASTEYPTVAGYVLLGELGRGGMGVVYRARHRALHRMVALKMIRSGVHADAEELSRFRAEAEAAARLQHPNLVQIFDVGEVDGQPYLALEYVDGGSLAQLLGGKPQPALQTARLLETVARAVQHAHQHGIVHRDLKPANILLQQSAPPSPALPTDLPEATPQLQEQTAEASAPGIHNVEPKVTDFGLAKRIDSEVGSSVVIAPTRTGAILGTPSYMAPEQAAGRVKDIGPATDIYALGAILYEMLTGRPPFLGETPLDTMIQVREQEPVPLRRLQPKAPRDLETISMKCLQKDPRKRYPDADSLAEDLRRFQAGEPIRARPVGAGERLWRWSRRNPRVAGLLALCVLLVVVGSSIVTRLWLLAEDRRRTAESNLREVDRQRDIAEANLDKARVAVDECFTIAYENPLLQQDGLQPVQKLLLAAPLRYYLDFIRQRESDPSMQRELARNYFRVARITNLTGSKEDAVAAYEKARDLLGPLAESHPDDVNLQYDLASTWNELGILRRQTGRIEDALHALQQARHIQERLVQAKANDALVRPALARTHNNLGRLYHVRGEMPMALKAYQAALDIFVQLIEAEPDRLEYRQRSAQCLDNMSLVYKDQGRLRDAIGHAVKARQVYQELRRRHPTARDYQANLAMNSRMVGGLHRANGDDVQALRLCEEGRDLWQNLARANPTVVEYWSNLADCCSDIGNIHQDNGRDEAAYTAYDQARPIYDALSRSYPTIGDFQSSLGVCHLNLGVQQLKKQPEKALELIQQGHDRLDKLTRANPQVVLYQSNFGSAFNVRGKAHRNLGRHSEAEADFKEAIARQRAALDKLPEKTTFRKQLSDAMSNYAELHRHLGRHAQAVELARERGRLYPRHPGELYNAACEHALCVPLVGAGKIDLTDEEQALRRQYADSAMGSLRAAVAAGFDKPAHLHMDKDLDALRSRDDFKKLLADLEAKVKP